MSRIKIQETKIIIDNQETKIISGGMHYFRIVPEYWRDRLEKLKLMGCNTVETYIPWNLSEPEEGQFNFTGRNDFIKFFEIAQEVGLYVIARPSTYICAEWEWGGTPYWLANKDNIWLRQSRGNYLKYVERYFEVIMPMLAQHTINKGKNIILVQIENEFGSFSNDFEYMKKLKCITEKFIDDIPLITCDGPWSDLVESGSLISENIIEAINFGSDAETYLKDFQLKHPKMPLMVMEFWLGWFDAYGEDHNSRNKQELYDELETILNYGHVNLYMAHGGTNYKLYNGSNIVDDKTLLPHTTTYDYDAPITEDGTLSEKFYKFKEIIEKYNGISDVILSQEIKFKTYDKVLLKKRVSVFDNIELISKVVDNDYPLTFEELQHPFGYVVYKTKINHLENEQFVKLFKAADRAHIYLNENELLDTQLFPMDNNKKVKFKTSQENNHINVMMENIGRTNFTQHIDYQKKGICHSIIVNGHMNTNVTHYCIDLENLDNAINETNIIKNTPTISFFEFEIAETADTYLKIKDWGKGVVVLNGEILSRFWEIGPQETIYIPAPLLKTGLNKIHFFETDGKVIDYIEFTDKPIWTNIKEFKEY